MTENLKSKKPSWDPPEEGLWPIALVPVLLAFLAYLPDLANGFAWDDGVLVQDNFHIRAWTSSNLSAIWTGSIDGNWMPLTQMSLALDYLIGGTSPKIFHFTNILLHCLNTGLVFFLSLKILNLQESSGVTQNTSKERKRAAWLTALLFGLHPVHVEAVAWAFERSTLLCATFFLGGLLAYLDYASDRGSRKVHYLSCLAFFALALFSKPLAVSFPVILFLLDLWPLGRFTPGPNPRVWLEKIPFFLGSCMAGLLAIPVQSGALALKGFQPFALPERVFDAFHSVVFYLWKLAFPLDLAVFYPLTRAWGELSLANAGMVLLVAALTFFCFWKAKKEPWWLAGWFWFLAALFPVLGIISAGSQAAADRYLYLSSLPLFLLLSGGLASLFTRRNWPFGLLGGGLAAVLWYATASQVGIWKDSVTLWERVLEVSPEASGLAYANLGQAYYDQGLLDQALKAWDQSILIGPPSAEAYEQKGFILLQKGSPELAVPEFQKALALEPQRASTHRDLFLAYQKTGRSDEALSEAQEFERLEPSSPDAYSFVGACEFKMGRYAEAIGDFQKALSLDPQNTIYLGNLASAYLSDRRYAQAIPVLQSVLIQKPSAGLYQSLAMAFRGIGNNAAAQECEEKAQALSRPAPIPGTGP